MSNGTNNHSPSYGFKTPMDLLLKLEREIEQFSAPPLPDEIFNSMVTAHCLRDWTKTHYKNKPSVDLLEIAEEVRLPPNCVSWISDLEAADLGQGTPEEQIAICLSDCLNLARAIANASKHYYWHKDVQSVSQDPSITDAYQYFFTSTRPDVYVTIEGRHYGVTQIASIVAQFYRGYLSVLSNE
ncbi:hypothetical protein AB2B41_08845 [Marimonas sp. MJW-29]|uniref:Uncharacterized protein n=1 Tax=Sulfitobacter sediminis TaxID=3234186 RepID=A0ABV3RLD2_9RHOB